jgi:hypothetical protein
MESNSEALALLWDKIKLTTICDFVAQVKNFSEIGLVNGLVNDSLSGFIGNFSINFDTFLKEIRDVFKVDEVGI